MEKMFLVWERECFDNYDVIFISKKREDAVVFINNLTGMNFEEEKEPGNVREQQVLFWSRKQGKYNSNVDTEIYIEQRELNKYDELSM